MPEDKNVNTQVGFETAMATAIGRELTDDEKSKITEGDRDVRAGLVIGDDDAPAPKAQVAAADEEDDDDGDNQEEEDDAASGSYDDGYAKALGEKSAEIAEARRQLEEERLARARLEGELSAYEEVPNEADPGMYQRVSQIAEENGGQQATLAAAQTGDRGLIDHAVNLWLDEGDDPDAVKYAIKWETWKNANPPEGPQQEPTVTASGLSEEDGASLLNLRQRAALDSIRTEMGVEKFNAIAPHVDKVLEGLPQTVKDSFGEQMAGTEAQIKEAYSAILTLAEPFSTQKATRVASESRKAEKKAAGVATGSASTKGGQSGEKVTAESSSEEKADWLRAEILKAPSTSVQDNIEWAGK